MRRSVAMLAGLAALLAAAAGASGSGDTPDGEVFSVLPGRAPTNVSRNAALDAAPSVSPRGALAFVSARSGRPQIHVAGAPGRPARRITRSPFPGGGRLGPKNAPYLALGGVGELSSRI